MTEQPAGSAFFERRLARAKAVPPADRTPEVAAFVASDEVCQLLPLTASGRPALAVGPAARERFLLALLKVAQVYYLRPLVPATRRDAMQRVAACLSSSPTADASNSRRRASPPGEAADFCSSPAVPWDRVPTLLVHALASTDLAAFQHAEPEQQRCKRLLPELPEAGASRSGSMWQGQRRSGAAAGHSCPVAQQARSRQRRRWWQF